MKTLPAIAFLLLASFASAFDVPLGWDAATSEPGVVVANYRLYEKSGENWLLVAVVPVPATTYSVGLYDYQFHTFAVSSANAAGEGAKSNLLTLSLVTLQSSPDLQTWRDETTIVVDGASQFFRLKLAGGQIVNLGRRELIGQ